jgi:hypothetical protein
MEFCYMPEHLTPPPPPPTTAATATTTIIIIITAVAHYHVLQKNLQDKNLAKSLTFQLVINK